MSIYVKLAAIQSALKAPKNQFNEFGGFPYRKMEDILEAVKPHLKAQGCTLTCTDELVLIGARYYIKATVTLTDTEKEGHLSTTAYAREEERKTGMDGSQITGASSSYARKYALNGLLCIDDTADSDTTNTGDGKSAAAKKTAAKTYASLSADKLARWVEAVARKEKTKDGEDAMTYFLREYNPTADELNNFNNKVFTYAVKNDIEL